MLTEMFYNNMHITIYLADAAIAYMAYKCINDPTYSEKSSAVLEYILNEQDTQGLFGNEYSTALALHVSTLNSLKTL